MTITEIRKEFIRKYKNEDFVVDKSGVKLIELLGVSFPADTRFIFGKVNDEYVSKEIKWYKSQSRNVYDMAKPPKIWRDIADKDGNINSNYGWCIYSKENGDQFKNAVRELRRNKDSRRATMIYTRPGMHTEYNINGMSDFICTNAVQVEIRDNKLYYLVQMRSNDAVFGYKNDLYWHKSVQQQLLDELKKDYKTLELGDIYWNSSSLHVYDRHYYLVYHYMMTGETTIGKKDFIEKYNKFITADLTEGGRIVHFFLDDNNIVFTL
jgi:thymidylate synthase